MLGSDFNTKKRSVQFSIFITVKFRIRRHHCGHWEVKLPADPGERGHTEE